MGRRLGNAAVALLCLLGVIVVNAATRDDPQYRWYVGRSGEVVVTPMFDVEVQGAVIAGEVSGGYTTLTTDEVFLVVRWSAAAKGRQALLGTGDVSLATADGTLIRQRNEFVSAGNLPVAPPGFTATGFSVFEVSGDRLEGAALEIRDQQGLFTSYAGAVRVTGLVDGHTERLSAVTLDEGTVEVSP